MSAGTVDGNAPPGMTSDRPVTVPPPRRKRRWLLGSTITFAVVALAVVIAGAILAANYQPVTFGGASAGLTGQIVNRQVDTFGPFGPQTYIPPQPVAHGSFIMSLENTGPRAVTIESVSMLAPGWPRGQWRNLVLAGAGPVTYSPLTSIPTAGSPRLAGATLAAGQDIYVRIPVISARCWVKHSWTAITSFWITTRYLLWTHHVQINWTGSGFPSDAFVAREATPAVAHTRPSMLCPGPGGS